tara:strand:+ start:2960 stop:4717 length:1758 start_codon:yes stop_codon:yes gene_type:complete
MPRMETVAAKLRFPLNVYAALMQATAEQSAFLAYGILQARPNATSPSADELIGAQRQLADQILAALALPAGARVLEVGSGSGLLARHMADAGLQVTAVDNNEAASKLSTQALGEINAKIFTADFASEWSQWAPQQYDALIFHNSARYFLPLSCFASARHLLADNGLMLIVDEFLTGTSENPKSCDLAQLVNVEALAARTGFLLQNRVDMSDDTANFLDAFIALFQGHRQELVALTDESPETISALETAMLGDLKRLQQGETSHQLLTWQMQAAAESLVPAETLRAEDFQQVFERSFKTDFSAALWHWKYGAGRGASVAALRGQQVVAHYGGIRRDILYFGDPGTAVQICDVMVMPEQRSFFSRDSLFFKTASTMLEQYAGYHARHLLGFGFPNMKAMHVAQRLKLYDKTDELVQLKIPVAQHQTDWHLQFGDMDAAVIEAAQCLWLAMKEGFTDSIIGVRDSAYLDYRFRQRPGLEYESVQIIDGDTLVAIIVLRPHGEHYLVMDILCEPALLGQVFNEISAYTQRHGRPAVFWLSAGQVDRLGMEAVCVESLGIHIPCNRWTVGPGAEQLQGAWWLTAGDMDFM